MDARTDRHNNPTAMTTDVARDCGLRLNIDYTQGDSFKAGALTLYTARFIGNPIDVTIRALDKGSFATKAGARRWPYLYMPRYVWATLSPELKRDVIGFCYENEGGSKMKGLFPNYGKR